MPVVNDLLKGFDVAKHTSIEEVIKLINTNASELKAKVLIDDGAENVFVPKARLDEEIGKKKTIQQTLDATNTELENIKKNVKGQEELVKQIETLQTTNKDLDGKLKDQTVETAIKLKAVEAKANDKTGADVLAFIDKSKLTLKDDGSIDGLEDAFKTLTEAKPYLFDAEAGGTGNPGQRGRGGNGNEGFQGIGKQLAEQQKQNSTNVTQAVDDLYFK